MTIVVGAASPDGIVLAADSRTMLMYENQRTRISTDAAEKVFELHGRFGAATYGTAFLGDQTINGVMNEFIASIGGDGCTDVEACAKAVGDFFTDRFKMAFPDYGPDPSGGWPLGFVVAGYDGAGIGHVWEVGVPGPLLIEQEGVSTTQRGVLWRGQADVIGRLIKGLDHNALVAAGITLEPAVAETLAKPEYILLLPATLQDAADLAFFLVRTTIDMQRFSDGTALAPGLVPGCGGRTQMLAVKPGGVEWISRRWYVGPGTPGLAEGSVDLD
jgi:hypothetical protein